MILYFFAYNLASNNTKGYALMKRILSGSVFEQYLACGKKNCICKEDRKYWHGPYWTWTRKVNGKTVLKRLSEQQAQKALEFIENNRQVLADLEAKRKEAEEYLLSLQ